MRRARLAQIPLLAILALVLALLASVALAARVPPIVTWLDVGSPGDEAYMRFDFPPESNGTETFRWTSGHAELSIPVERAGRYRLDLRLATISPGDRVLEARCGARTHAIPLASIGDSTVPIECDTGDDRIELTFEVPVVYLPGGGRALGVSVRDIRATALDADDRLALRAYAGLTIFGSLAGAGLALAALRPGSRWLWLAGPGALAAAWFVLIERRPDLVLSAISGPEGVLILAAGVTAWLLARGKTWNALAIAGLAVVVVLAIPQPDAALLLEAPWTRAEVNALRVLPGLAAIAVVAGAALGGRRGHWLAGAGAAVGLLSITMPALSSWAVRHWKHQIRGPAWVDTGSVAGALYISAAFGIGALAIMAVLAARERLLLRVTLAATAMIAALLLWRIEVMILNGDEQHYYVMARSLAVDGDFELLNNYLEPQFIESTYSPVGNIFDIRATPAGRYAGGVPAPEGSWYLLPPLDDGWEVDGDATGLLPAGEPAPLIHGPQGKLAIPPPLTPATRHAILLQAPCAVDTLVAAAPPGSAPGALDLTITNAAGEQLYAERRDALPPDGLLAIPPEAGLCQGTGAWTVSVEAPGPFVVEAIDRHEGLELAAGHLQGGWLFAGLPRDNYGSVSGLTQLLLHNPSDQILLVTVRLITASDLTTSEITIGIPPGTTTVEPLPVFGAEAVAVLATDPVEFSAALYGIVLGARYRMPATQPVETFTAPVAANPDRDAGLWLTVVNPTSEPQRAELRDGERTEALDLCGACATTLHVEAGDDARTVQVSGVEGAWIAPAVVAYEERTGEPHFDVGLPLLAAPLAHFDAYWPVLIATALAGISIAPGLFLLLRANGMDQRAAAPAALTALACVPVSTYAVRFYTDIVTAALLLWAVVLWERGSRRALAGMAVIAVALPFLHGRMTPLAVAVLALALLSAAPGALPWARSVLRRYPPRLALIIGVVGVVVLATAALFAVNRYAFALGSRGIENFFGLEWVARNSVGMLLDRGTGLLPFAPWLVFALAAPRPLRRSQRAIVLLALLYYAVLALRSGGWQTWGSPMRYLLPIIPLVAALALPGIQRLWRTGRLLPRLAIIGSLVWSLLVTMLLHWRPLAGYVDRGGPRNNYLIDQALSWLPFPSPFEFMPTIEAQPGPGWTAPLGVLIILALAAAALWSAWPLVRDLVRAGSSDMSSR